MVQFDWCVGEIMNAVKANDLENNTLIIFSSDNGPVYDDGYADGCTVKKSTEEVDRGHDGSAELRGGKYQIYEGGTRVPFIVSWPNTIQPGTSEALIGQIDLMASFAELLDQQIPEGEAGDSQNLLPALLGKDQTGAANLVEQGRGGQTALRQGPWKYIPPTKANKRRKTPAKPAQLYNLNQDIGESQNIATDHPELAESMARQLNKIIQAKEEWK
jgi:arylsulfatase A-like enzyme